VTDSFAARGNSFQQGASLDWNDNNFEPSPTSNTPMAAGNNSPATRHLDLRESLEWLLGATPEHEDLDMPADEKSARRNRRMDLLLWILNLEPRLAPYGE